MKQVLKIHRKVFAFLLALLLPQLAHSESYSLNVGESVNISQTAYNGGYIDNVGLADYIDPHLTFSKNYDGSAKITVNSYFDYSTTVKLVFIERYQSFYNGRNHTLAYTYYKNVTIKCNYQKPESGPKPTKVLLPERIRLNVYNGGELDYIQAILVPAGAKASEYYWYDDKGTANFSAIMTTDGRYRIMGRSPGIGKISVVVDDDWTNLHASAILEIVDPAHLPPSSIFLPSSIEIGVNKNSTLIPTLIPENTSTAFTWKSDDESIATVEYGKVVGKKAGTTNITLTTANQLQSTCKVTVINGSGKDDEEESEDNTTGMVGGHEYADLGLSVKWATCNVGATSPEENGAYYAWGETNEKSSYNWNSYAHGTSMANPTHLGNDIKSTKYDAAYANWGKDWRMPTAVEIGELISKCTFKEDTVEGVKGYRATGPNGQSIFFPSAGRKRSSNFDTGCWYWSSIEDDYLAKTLSISKNSNSVVTPSVKSWDRSYGLPIRPVTSSEGTSVEPTDVTLPASKAVEIDKYITLTASLTPSNAKTELTWTSDDTSIATVSSSGVVKGIKEGTTYIHVKTANGKTAKCELTVYANNKITEIEINPSNLSMVVGDTQQLTATITPSNATDKSVTWKSSNTTVATINTTGLVTAVSEGSATITCTANDGSGVKATCSISVTKKSYSVKDSGVEGNITWVLTTDGTLTLSGKGAMEGYWTHAWEEYKNDIKKIIIEKGLTGIALNAFRDCSSLISVTIPNSVTSIGSYSFCNCSSLTSVTIPNSVKSIESGAFWNCTSLVSVTIPNSVTSIGGWAFMDCISLSSLFIPSSVIEMEYSPFDRCTALTDLQIDKENPSFMIEDGIIFSKDKTTLFFYLYSKKDKSYTIPSTITKLAYGAFSYNPHLTSVIIPNSITSIESASFFRCTGLISVTIPNTVTSIGEQAFEGCQSLSSIYIPNSVELIGESAFWECKNLETVKIGSGVKSIDVMTFGNCSALRTLYCYAATPPILGYRSYSKIGVFDHAGPATLYVPKESVAAYKVADQWKDFKAIMPLENVDPSMTTTVTTSSAGYATFYDSKISYVLPYGLSAQVVTGCANKKLTYTTIATGSSSGIIPKGTAVMLVADNRWAGTYILTATEESASYTGTNYLYGSDTATTTSASGSNYYYKLTNGPSNNSPFGWYWGAANGTTFQIEGHKAWLALPQTMSRSLSFSAEGEATDIDEWQDTDAPAIIYDLQGRCVNEAKGQGLYIQNGKKRIVK